MNLISDLLKWVRDVAPLKISALCWVLIRFIATILGLRFLGLRQPRVRAKFGSMVVSWQRLQNANLGTVMIGVSATCHDSTLLNSFLGFFLVHLSLSSKF